MAGYKLQDDYHFFYSGPFSNWSNHKFFYQGIEFRNVEQYMMYYKAMLFQDEYIAAKILESDSPLKVKKLGRQVSNFNSDTWDTFKYQIVFVGCLQKAIQNSDIRETLQKTGDKILVEASPTDRVWGIGFDKDNALLDSNKNNWGENLLGRIWTEIKTILFGDEILFGP